MNRINPQSPELTLPLALAQSAQQIDTDTIESLGTSGRVLMECAGVRASDAIWDRLGHQAQPVLVLCGGGNNGGDGYVVARHLAERGCSVTCAVFADPTTTAAQQAARAWAEGGGRSVVVADTLYDPRALVAEHTVIVDGLLGIGLTRPVAGLFAEWIQTSNDASHALRVALDTPSGLCVDTGRALGCAFHAHLTLTFGVAKLGLYQGDGYTSAGEVVTLPIGFCPRAVERHCANLRLAKVSDCLRAAPPRLLNGHKGTYGHLVLIGGRGGLRGAIELAANAALRMGVGRVTWAREADADPVGLPAELMHLRIDDLSAASFQAMVIGPGLLRDDLAATQVASAWRGQTPAVFDADALRLMGPLTTVAPGHPGHLLLPHPGEAAALLGCDIMTIQRDRLAAARDLAARFQCVVALKGANTLVAMPTGVCVVVPGGQPSLSIGGTGDVLAGVCGALLAQGASAAQAAVTASSVIVRTAKRLGAQQGDRGLLPSELTAAFPRIIAEEQSLVASR